MVDALVLGTSVERRVGSNPSIPTNLLGIIYENMDRITL